MKKIAEFLVGILAVFFLSGCALIKMLNEQQGAQKAHDPAEYGFRPPQHSKRHIRYAKGEPGQKYLELDAYWNESKTPQPVMVVIHGGAWLAGSKASSENQLIAWYFANHGYVTFSVNYRLIPAYQLRDCIKDVFGAVVWSKQHAREFGGDPARVGVAGFSAGAHLAAMVAAAGDRTDIFPPTGNTGAKYDASVLAAVDFYGLYDMSSAPPDIFPLPDWMNRTFYRFVYSGDPKKNAEYGKLISPMTYVSNKTPPQLVVCGDADRLHLYPQSVEYVEALKKAGRPVEFIAVKGADHSFNVQYWTEESKTAYLAMISFLDRYLK
jgi:acetyl esterase/lipase